MSSCASYHPDMPRFTYWRVGNSTPRSNLTINQSQFSLSSQSHSRHIPLRLCLSVKEALTLDCLKTHPIFIHFSYLSPYISPVLLTINDFLLSQVPPSTSQASSELSTDSKCLLQCLLQFKPESTSAFQQNRFSRKFYTPTTLISVLYSTEQHPAPITSVGLSLLSCHLIWAGLWWALAGRRVWRGLCELFVWASEEVVQETNSTAKLVCCARTNNNRPITHRAFLACTHPSKANFHLVAETTFHLSLSFCPRI